jgi:hypothetical protein
MSIGKAIAAGSTATICITTIRAAACRSSNSARSWVLASSPSASATIGDATIRAALGMGAEITGRIGPCRRIDRGRHRRDPGRLSSARIRRPVRARRMSAPIARIRHMSVPIARIRRRGRARVMGDRRGRTRDRRRARTHDLHRGRTRDRRRSLHRNGLPVRIDSLVRIGLPLRIVRQTRESRTLTRSPAAPAATPCCFQNKTPGRLKRRVFRIPSGNHQ